MTLLRLSFVLLCCLGSIVTHGQTKIENQVTILVDAFSQSKSMKLDWGYAALIEYEGKRILFDTGNNTEIFAHNLQALQIDLTQIDFVVISHRHGDHTDGLRHLLKVNPRVKIYVPNDEYFGMPTPTIFFRQPVKTLPMHMRYFSGTVPQQVPHGSPWKEASFTVVDSISEVLPGIKLVRNLADGKLFGETPELSLSIQTSQGQVLVVGCSHPGIEKILGSLSAESQPVHLLLGGMHLVTTPPAQIKQLTVALREKWKIANIAPGHCTGEVAFATLQESFKEKYLYAGVGSVIKLP
jgi:7,8-dihydropterin-6-yl-methyl-4-(beta-D-ribofuranosyl)aminobenzene 5'-phosphate synthase